MSSAEQLAADEWSIENTKDALYVTKLVTCPDVIADWLADEGSFCGKDVLEFGCGEGTMALGVALRQGARRVVGVEVLDVCRQCLPLAREQIGLRALPSNLELRQIDPGGSLERFGQFDVVYSWSVFEHVSQALIPRALSSIAAALKPEGAFFLQISPLYYSANGSHLGPWVEEPWAHLSMQQDALHQQLLAAPTTPAKVRSEWSVYIPLDADTSTERASLWETYVTLNKVTAPQLCRLVEAAGLKIVRDYRTYVEISVPRDLEEIYQSDVLRTEQIVLLMKAETAQQ